MIVYIDSDFKCHTTNPNGVFREFDVPFFDGKCQRFVEGYKYCPDGESYVGKNGDVFRGECIVPWKDYWELDDAQREYERNLLAEYKEELAVLDAALLDAQYNILVGGI